MSNKSATKIASVSDIAKAASGEIITLPGYSSGDYINIKVRRPSLMEMAATGKIPNPLIDAAARLFTDGIDKQKDGESFTELSSVMICVAKAALVEPTYKQLEEAGVSLTDQQLMFLYHYITSGVDALRPFRDVEDDKSCD